LSRCRCEEVNGESTDHRLERTSSRGVAAAVGGGTGKKILRTIEDVQHRIALLTRVDHTRPI
jgi:hypothetical protein